jgi:hypothetical protein
MNLVEQKSVHNLLILQTILSHYYKTIKIELFTIDKNIVLSSPLGLPFSRIAHFEVNSGLQAVGYRPSGAEVPTLSELSVCVMLPSKFRLKHRM